MRISNEVKNFFLKLWGTRGVPYKELKELITDDIDAFDTSVTDRSLSRQISLDGSWSSYWLNDVDIYYDDQALKISERLDMFGIREMAPVIRSGDNGLIIVYRFVMPDIYGNTMDIVTGFRVSIKRRTDAIDTRRIIVYG